VDNQKTAKAEQQSLELLRDIVTELGSALNSLVGKDRGGILNQYKVHSAKHIFRAADGFISLRKLGHKYCSKLLIRPAIEVALRLEAVRKDGKMLSRVAAWEHSQDQKQLRTIAEPSGNTYDEQAGTQGWAKKMANLQKEFPNEALEEQPLGAAAAAQFDGLMPYYNTHYRLYSQYTHGVFRATGDLLDDLTDKEDNLTMAMCAFVALNLLASMDLPAPNLQGLFERLSKYKDTPPSPAA
jgi:uncharacterized protein DUF5677